LGSHFKAIKRAGVVENPSEEELEQRERFDSTEPRPRQLSTMNDHKVASKEQINVA